MKIDENLIEEIFNISAEIIDFYSLKCQEKIKEMWEEMILEILDKFKENFKKISDDEDFFLVADVCHSIFIISSTININNFSESLKIVFNLLKSLEEVQKEKKENTKFIGEIKDTKKYLSPIIERNIKKQEQAFNDLLKNFEESFPK